MKENKSFWKDKHSAVSFYLNTEGKMESKIFSKVYPSGKITNDWSYVKAGFGLLSGYDKVDENEFNKVIQTYK